MKIRGVVLERTGGPLTVCRRVTDAVKWQGSPEATAEAVREASGGGVDYAIEASGGFRSIASYRIASRSKRRSAGSS